MVEELAKVVGVPVTPFTPEGAVDEAAMASVVARMARQGVQVIVPCGGTGEFSALTADERERVARVSVEAAGTTPVLVGVGGDAASASRAARRAVEAGAAGVMIHALTDPYLTPDGI